MARLNNILKFLLMNVNVIFATIGLAFFAFSLYLFAGNFGDLDPEFFLGVGLILCFVGLSIMFGSCLGCQGAANQNQRLGKSKTLYSKNCPVKFLPPIFYTDSFWTGRKIIFLYELLLLGSLAVELYLLSLSLRAAGEYKLTYPEVEQGKCQLSRHIHSLCPSFILSTT